MIHNMRLHISDKITRKYKSGKQKVHKGDPLLQMQVQNYIGDCNVGGNSVNIYSLLLKRWKGFISRVL